MKKSKMQSRSGFTLVELIIVLLIIAVIWMATFLGGATLIKKARTTHVKETLHNYATYVEDMLYCNPGMQSDTTKYSIENVAYKDNVVTQTSISKDVLDKLNLEYLTHDFQLADGMCDGMIDVWDNPYLFSYAISTTATTHACIVIHSVGPNGIDESINKAEGLATKAYISAEDAVSEIDAGDDYGIVVWVVKGQVSTAYYGFDNKGGGPGKEYTEQEKEIIEKFDKIDSDKGLNDKANEQKMPLDALQLATKLCAMANIVNMDKKQLDSATKMLKGTYSNSVQNLLNGYDIDKYSWAISYNTNEDHTEYIIVYEGEVLDCKVGMDYDVMVFVFSGNECVESYNAICGIRLNKNWNNYFKDGYSVFDTSTLRKKINEDLNGFKIDFSTETISKTGDCLATIVTDAKQNGTPFTMSRIDSISTNGSWYKMLVNKLAKKGVEITTDKTWCLSFSSERLINIYFTENAIQGDGTYPTYLFNIAKNELTKGAASVTGGKIVITSFE